MHVTSEVEVTVESNRYAKFVENMQSKATADDSELDLIRRVSGLAAEAGEVVGAQEKFLRKYGTLLSEGDLDHNVEDKITDELGDTLFWVQAICNSLGISLEDLKMSNYKKLTARHPEGFDATKGRF